jgi:RHS repeat-associated protein
MPLSRSPNDLTTPERSGHWGAALLHAEIYLGSAPAVARFDEGFLSAGIRYFHNGHLSLRVTADSNGTKVGEQGHFPFGEDWYLSGAVAKYRFTGYERDSESGNDYALARYHINRLGRFSSPDRIAGSIGDPQTLNRYAYVRNDPVNLTDPSGQLAAAWETFFNWLLGIGCTWEDILEGRACSGDPAGGGGETPQKIKDIVNTALKHPRLSKCLNELFGPGTILTNENLPKVDATKDLPGATVGRTDPKQVPETGRATVQIDRGIYRGLPASDPLLIGTYLHEVANALAIQRFTDVFPGEDRWMRAYLGPQGNWPSKEQLENYDQDIGAQFEKCLNRKE